ncbi:MAG: 5'-3' exonuclease H3TH domain-containing protein, partial [Pseudomonadota bacterium]
REATRAFNLACIEQEGWEADDLIATYAVEAREAGARVTIISSDKDLMQLVGGGVEMVDGMKAQRIGIEEVEAKFGVGPEKVVDVQALAGDSVDNVPGAPGIGIKTAALLIQEYGDVETLLERAEEIKQPKRRQSLIDNAEQIRVSKRLVTLAQDVPYEVGFEEMEVREPEPEKVVGFLQSMEFRTLTNRIAEKLGVEPPALPEPAAQAQPGGVELEMPPIDPSKYEIVRDATSLQRWIDAISERGYVAVDTETTGLDEMVADLVGICLSVEAGGACYIPLGHVNGAGDLLGGAERSEGQMDLDVALDMLRPVLESDAILKILQNAKYDLKIFARYDVTLGPIEDTMLLSYAMHGGLHGHGMDALSERYLDHKPIPIKSLLGTGKSQITFDLLKIEDAAPYAAEDADVTLRLWHLFRPQLHRTRVTQVYETMERPLVPVLAEMEMNGIKVNRDHLSRMSNTFAQKMAALEAEIQELAGESFNV